MSLPDLRTRHDIQSYLLGVAKELGVALEKAEVAAELDRRDQLARFREEFNVPTIGELLDENEREKGTESWVVEIQIIIIFSFSGTNEIY